LEKHRNKVAAISTLEADNNYFILDLQANLFM